MAQLDEVPYTLVDMADDAAEAIPHAELLVIEGMGHDLPPEVWPQVVGAIAAPTDRAENR